MKKQTVILALCIVLNILQYNIWQYIQHNFFYIAESVQYFLVGTIIYSLAAYIKKYTESKKIKQDMEILIFVSILWIIFAVNDLTDLLFFNPNVFGWNEVVFCAAGLIVTIIKLRKRWKE